MARMLVPLLVLLIANAAAKDHSFLMEDLLDRLLDDDYCRASHNSGLSADKCKQTKWDELVSLIRGIMSNCITLPSLIDTEHPLVGLSKNKTLMTPEGLRSIILAYVEFCLKEEKIGTPSEHSSPSNDPCTSADTQNLTEWWRQDDGGSNIRPINGQYNCDKELQNNKIWFRFKGAAGDHLADNCVKQLSCGSHGGFWSDAKMPTKVGDIWKVPVYGSLNHDCNWYTWSVRNPLTVKRCSEKEFDFVYKLHGTQECQWSVCGTD